MDEAELSQILREQFRMLGEQIGLACNVPEPLKPLLTGEDAEVVLRLHKGNLRIILPVVEVVPEPVAVNILEDDVSEIDPNWVTDNTVLTEDISEPNEEPTPKILDEPVKKKRRRRKTTT